MVTVAFLLMSAGSMNFPSYVVSFTKADYQRDRDYYPFMVLFGKKMLEVQ